MELAQLRDQVTANITGARQRIATLSTQVTHESVKRALDRASSEVDDYERTFGAQAMRAVVDDDEARQLRRALDTWHAAIPHLKLAEEAVQRYGPEQAVIAGSDAA